MSLYITNRSLTITLTSLFITNAWTRFDRFNYVFDSTDFQTPGEIQTPEYSTGPCNELGAFGDGVAEADGHDVAEVDEQDKESVSDATRFIISDLSDIFISDIFMASIDWLGTYLLDLLGTFDFPSLSTSLVS